MPQCNKCNGFFPPDVMIKQKTGGNFCVFCDRKIETIKYGDLKQYTVTRIELMNEYKEFMDELVKRRNIQSILESEKFKKFMD